ncbi:hypothetical protein J4Q44_G00027220 [Coregonus suidteri]|uniref:Uncharacterized protein n=1 Tax=Coregonus suidteri TaxID=861788 RepID=A0AAN8MK69_9TELE
MNNALADKCPPAPKLLGVPILRRFMGQSSLRIAVGTGARSCSRLRIFTCPYIDYGNTEFVSRSALVEAARGSTGTLSAKKYKFWGLLCVSDQDSADFQQGKAFLQNLIYGKKVRIQKKSVCFDGTILSRLSRGTWDIGEEVLKMKFAKFTLPESNRESPMSVAGPAGVPCLWPQRVLDWAGPQGTGTCLALQSACPDYGLAFPDQKEKSKATAQHAANLVKKKDQEWWRDNHRG